MHGETHSEASITVYLIFRQFISMNPHVSADDRGETDADEEFIRRFTASQRDVRSYVVSMTPSLADADDVLQEVNLALWKKRGDYDAKQSFLRWATGFASMEIRAHRSRSARNRLWFSDVSLELLTEAWCASYETTVEEQRRQALSACLARLHDRDRRIVTAFYAERDSAQDIARQHNRQLSTVYKALTRAREQLRACIDRTLAEAGRA